MLLVWQRDNGHSNWSPAKTSNDTNYESSCGRFEFLGEAFKKTLEKVILNVFVLGCSAHPMYDGTCICQVLSDEHFDTKDGERERAVWNLGHFYNDVFHFSTALIVVSFTLNCSQ